MESLLHNIMMEVGHCEKDRMNVSIRYSYVHLIRNFARFIVFLFFFFSCLLHSRLGPKQSFSKKWLSTVTISLVIDEAENQEQAVRGVGGNMGCKENVFILLYSTVILWKVSKGRTFTPPFNNFCFAGAFV